MLEGMFFTNPILDEGSDPWVVQAGGRYYLSQSDNKNRILILESDRMEDISKGKVTEIYCAPNDEMYSLGIWAPEIHYIDGMWYCYFAACDGRNETHRMYVLRGGNNKQDPLDGGYEFIGKISDKTDKWAIDGTVLNYEGKNYFIWSGWEGDVDVRQNIYIAEMSDPCTISGERFLIATPECEWELLSNPLVNEGPQIIKRNGNIYMLFSANGSWTDDYCMGVLIHNGGDVTRKSSWINKTKIFEKSVSVFGPGHGSVIKSPSGEEDWMVYHAAKRKGSGWDRNIRMQKMEWWENMPVLGLPVSEGIKLSALK